MRKLFNKYRTYIGALAMASYFYIVWFHVTNPYVTYSTAALMSAFLFTSDTSVCKTCDGTRMVRTSRDEKVSNPGVYDKKCPDCA